jgi:hypothetical protein
MSSGMTLPHVGIEAEIEDVRLGAVFVLQNRNSLGRNDFRHRIIRVSQVRQSSCAERTAFNAGWLHAFADSVVTEVALVGDLVVWMKEAHAVGAGHDAVAATNAPIPVDQDYAIVGLVGCPDRAHLDTGRVVALVTELRHKERLANVLRVDFFIAYLVIYKAIATAHWGIDMRFTILGYDVSFDPGARYRCVLGDFIFNLTGFYAKSAAHAFRRVYLKCPACF